MKLNSHSRNNNPGNHYQAIMTIGALGEEGKPALPILYKIGKGVRDNRRRFRDEQMPLRALAAMAQLAPAEPATLDLLIQCTEHDPNWPFSSTPQFAVNLLGRIAIDHPALRPKIVPTLVRLLDPPAAAGGGQSLLAVIHTLGMLGRDAEAASGALKKLKLHENAQVRTAAAWVLEEVNAPPNDPEHGKSRTWVVSLAPGAEDAKQMQLLAGKAVRATVSSALQSDVDLFVFDGQGRQLAADTTIGPNCVVEFVPPTSGFYRIVVRNLGPGDNRSRVRWSQ